MFVFPLGTKCEFIRSHWISRIRPDILTVSAFPVRGSLVYSLTGSWMSNSSLIRGAWNSSNRQLLESQSRSCVIQDSKSKIQPGNPFILCPRKKSIPPLFFLEQYVPAKVVLFIFLQMKSPWCSLLRLRASLRWRGGSAKLFLSLWPTDCHTYSAGEDLCLHMTSHTHTHTHTEKNDTF